MIISLAACAAGFFLDFIFGDPVWLYHPVRMIGKGISFGERQLRKLCSENESGTEKGSLLASGSSGNSAAGKKAAETKPAAVKRSRQESGDLLPPALFCGGASQVFPFWSPWSCSFWRRRSIRGLGLFWRHSGAIRSLRPDACAKRAGKSMPD